MKSINKKQYNLVAGGMFIAGIGIGFLFGAGNSANVDYILGAIFAIIGIIILFSSRFVK